MNIPNKEESIWTALIDAGFKAYLVGGAVRDILLGHNPKDWDFATNATPAQIQEIFMDGFGFKLDFVGASFGVMMVDGVEVATFRGDRYFGGGDKDVEISYVETIEEDLARRDFTINAMAMDMGSFVIDPFGGQRDLTKFETPIIRFVGEAVDRINEDPNRIMRAMRFAARFKAEFDAETWYAILNAVREGKISMIAPERIHLEIMKTMGSVENASVFWYSLKNSGILDEIIPEMVLGYNHDHGNHHDEDIWTHNMIAGDFVKSDFPLIKLAAYLHDVGKPASYDSKMGTFYEHQHYGADIVRERLTALKFSGEEIKFVVNLVLIHMDGTRGMSAKSRRKLKSKLNAYGLKWEEYLAVRVADRAGNTSRPNFTTEQIGDYIEMFEMEEEVPFDVTDLAISGGEIIEIFSLTPGPIVGKIQRQMLQKVIDDGDVWNTCDNLIGFIVNEFNLEPLVDIFD